jgi:hypothetical protein
MHYNSMKVNIDWVAEIFLWLRHLRTQGSVLNHFALAKVVTNRVPVPEL